MTRPLTTLRILSWNIHKGVGGVDRRYDLGRVADVLARLEPDLALLQEVAQGMPSLRGDDQVQRLGALDGLFRHAEFHPEHQFRRGGYGNLILSRYPLHDPEHLDLTIGVRKKRGLVKTHVVIRHDEHQRTLVVHNMHLGLAGSERARQLQRFLESEPFRGIHHSTPIIVGGDLNDLWGGLGPKFLAPAGFQRAGKLENTFPAMFPLRPLDGLFYRGDMRLIDAGVARDAQAKAASDHLPIWADFELPVAF
ncbi:MAG: hypothetical protein RJA70_2039 [Pseudomonadota bacterium]